jgi:uncharacterized protein
MKPARGSSDAEVEALDRVAERLAGFDERVSSEWLDGWLAALAAGPVRPPADEWLALMLDDSFERTFADPPDRADALAVLEARLAVLLDQLDPESLEQDPEAMRLDPIMWEWSDEQRRRMAEESGFSLQDLAAVDTGSVWAEGFLDGLDALMPVWGGEPGDDESLGVLTALVDQIGLLRLAPDDAKMRELLARYHQGRTATRDELVAEACFAVQDLRLFWLDHGPRPEPRRVSAAPGRNDPCPCGSGRKYKKCHGAAA